MEIMKCEICSSELVLKKIGTSDVPYCDICKKILPDIIEVNLDIFLKGSRKEIIDEWERIKPINQDRKLSHLYEEIALKSKNSRIRRQAARYVNDEVLAQICNRDHNYHNRVLALSLITEERYIVHIALNGKTLDEKKIAIQMLETMKSLAIVSEKTKNNKLQQLIDKQFSKAY